MICDNVIIRIFIVQAFVLSTCTSFNIKSSTSLIAGTNYPKQRLERLPFGQHVSYLKLHHGSDSDGMFQNLDNSTGFDTPLFFADEECYDLCEIAEEDEVEDGILDVPAVLIDAGHGVAMNLATSLSLPSTSRNSEKSTEQIMGNLELRWNIDEDKDDCDLEDVSTCSDACDVCVGRGVIDCQFCNGVGWIDFGEQTAGTMGERLVERNGGIQGTECPVCNEDSAQICQKCMGSGWIARWRMRNLNKDHRP